MQGFASKGYNCAPGYGDYPPGSQIMAAWLMHLFGEYDEGLMLSSYFVAIQIYTAPILKWIPKNCFVYGLSTLWLFVMYSFAPNVMLDRSPDVLMAVIYGSSLINAYVNRDVSGNGVDLALILSVLILMKSIGIEWVIFAVLFAILIKSKKNIKHLLFLTMPFLIYFSWYIFYHINERTTYLTQNLKGSLEAEFWGNELLKEYGTVLLCNFGKALFMKQQTTILGIGLSVVSCLVIYYMIIFALGRKELLCVHELKVIKLFIGLSFVLAYGILLYSIETMFLGEYGLYIDKHNMLLFVKRYGCPYVLGSFLLIIYSV